MKVGDLVRYKHDHAEVGLITKVDPNVHDSVTYKVWVTWPERRWKNDHFPMSRETERVTYNYQLEIINE